MSARRRLPTRRVAETFDLEVEGLRYTYTIGRYPSGETAEIFLQNHKPGSQNDSNARDAAAAASGCPLSAGRIELRGSSK
jgi:hypothetical protein